MIFAGSPFPLWRIAMRLRFCEPAIHFRRFDHPPASDLSSPCLPRSAFIWYKSLRGVEHSLFIETMRETPPFFARYLLSRMNTGTVSCIWLLRMHWSADRPGYRLPARYRWKEKIVLILMFVISLMFSSSGSRNYGSICVCRQTDDKMCPEGRTVR